jgi:hypothetical protein
MASRLCSRVYAGCIDGQDAAANQRISDALDERRRVNTAVRAQTEPG